MAAVRFQLSKGRAKRNVTVGVDTDYDGQANITIIVDPAVVKRRADVEAAIEQIKDAILERATWP